MSLTSHLKDPASPVRRFFEERLPNTLPVVRTVNTHLVTGDTILPQGIDRSYPYNLVGTAFDYRLRYYFALTDPARFVAWEGAVDLAGGFEPVHDEWVLNRRTGDLATSVDLDSFGSYAQSYVLAAAFFAALQVTLDRVRPVRTRLAQNDEELLARYCWVLALYEQIYRSGQIPDGLATAQDVDDLLALAPSAAVHDLCRLSWAFYDDFHTLIMRPAILNPTFDGSTAIGGADADLIVDGCLVDIKVTKNPRLDKLWLYQLLGYVLLDYTDRYQIKQVGIYFARQKTDIRWATDSLIHSLSSDTSLSVETLRRQFRQLLGEPHRRKIAGLSAGEAK